MSKVNLNAIFRDTSFYNLPIEEVFLDWREGEGEEVPADLVCNFERLTITSEPSPSGIACRCLFMLLFEW